MRVKAKTDTEDLTKVQYLSRPCAVCFIAFNADEKSFDFESDEGQIYRCHKPCYDKLIE